MFATLSSLSTPGRVACGGCWTTPRTSSRAPGSRHAAVGPVLGLPGLVPKQSPGDRQAFEVGVLIEADRTPLSPRRAMPCLALRSVTPTTWRQATHHMQDQ